MRPYKMLVRKLLATYTSTLRKDRNLTQEKMAEQLRITSRAYGDLERGKYCFSAVALLFLLLMLKDDELKDLLEEFRSQVQALEHREIG